MIVKGETIEGLRKAIQRKISCSGYSHPLLFSHIYPSESGKFLYVSILLRAKNHADGEWGFSEPPAAMTGRWWWWCGMAYRYRDDICAPYSDRCWGTVSIVENIWGEVFDFTEVNTGEKFIEGNTNPH